METAKPVIPRTPAVRYILLALASADTRGAESLRQAKRERQGQMTMGMRT